MLCLWMEDFCDGYHNLVQAAVICAVCVLVGLAGCTDGEWRADEWNDMENMCRGSAYCSAPCRGGESSAQSGCNEGM
jgi:hypothetical protein